MYLVKIRLKYTYIVYTFTVSLSGQYFIHFCFCILLEVQKDGAMTANGNDERE
jgi:hypothetical protein